MSMYEFLMSLNILDISQDFFFISQYQYPGVYTVVNSGLMSIYEILTLGSIILLNAISMMFHMKMLNSAVFNMGIKFILLIALLVFVRGGIPRYRFDFLTKIGWIKFLSLILSIFLSSMLLIFLF